jgi:DNA-nicking Smr family endonuclease
MPRATASPAQTRQPRKSTRLALGDLGQVAETLKEQRLAAERAAKAAALAHERALREANVFRDAVADVTPLPDTNRAHLAPNPPYPNPRQHEADEHAALLSSLSDPIDPDALLETDQDLSFARDGISPISLRRLRRGHWVVQGQCDLHGLTREYAREELAQFLAEALRRGWRCVRIVHGKGLGSRNKTPVLKAKVRHWLQQHDAVLAFCQARPAEGGAGALMVLLRAAEAG